MKNLVIFFLFLASVSVQSQNKKDKGYQWLFVPSVEYVNQKKQCMGTWAVVGINPNKHPHTFIMANLGGYTSWFGKTTYFSPGFSCEIYDQIDKTHRRIGLYARAGFTNYRFGDLQNNTIYGDIGLSNFALHFFVGYNFFMNKPEVNPIAPFRFGIKLL